MLGNYLFLSNVSLSVPDLFYISPFKMCLTSRPGSAVFLAFFITNIFLLPLHITVLSIGLKWYRSSSTVSVMSHSDCFTYHLVTMELFGVVGSILICCGISHDPDGLVVVGVCLWEMTWFGELLIHNLTCVERYLAVVHPITYLNLKSERGIRVRNIFMGCVWLLCFGTASLSTTGNMTLILYFCCISFSIIITSFCSLSVLYVLKHSGPGEQSGNRKRIDKLKQKAFFIIIMVLGVLSIKFIWGQALAALYVLGQKKCMYFASGIWLNLPTSLLLPLLFLNKAKLLICFRKRKNKV